MIKKTVFTILFLLLAPVSSISFSAEQPLWIEAAGEAVLGDIDTPNEVKERARRDAQKNALEMAVGVFVKSHTIVSNSQLAEDLVYAAVRGRVEKSEILREGWDPKDRTLKKRCRHGEGLSYGFGVSGKKH